MMANTSNRVVVLASADVALRGRLQKSLSSMRWRVCEVRGGAEALAHLEEHSPGALVLDSWLPDLEVNALASQIRQLYPSVDLLRLDGQGNSGGPRSGLRHELLQAMREALNASSFGDSRQHSEYVSDPDHIETQPLTNVQPKALSRPHASAQTGSPGAPVPVAKIAGLIGESAPMLEMVRLIRLVAPHDARVLIEGETGTGKELVANAVHALSARSQKPFVVLNCAAIPESLLEAELFGHTRGAFTGAVQARTGRIEAAHGGTLFLDEIGEMPLPLQSKLLRFLENGELQRVGDNETVRVDVRVVAATHQAIEQRAEEGAFRLDLFHRLAVFPIEVPPLRERVEDIPSLSEYFLAGMARTAPRKYLDAFAMQQLLAHGWPGNVRELLHVLQRAAILAGDQPKIEASHIKVRSKLCSK